MITSAGGALCFAGMILLRRTADEKNMWFLSVIGAVLGYLPVLLFSGCIAGLFTGLCAQPVTARLNSRRKTRTEEK